MKALAGRFAVLRRSFRQSFGNKSVMDGAPYGNRTRVSAVKGRRPGPLDEGRAGRRARYKVLGREGQALPYFHHFPVFGIDSQGSLGGSGAPFCRSSMECLSGERTKAICPSRGGRLMVTPAFKSLSQRA